MKGLGMLCFDGDTPVQVAPQVASNAAFRSANNRRGKRSTNVPTIATKAIKDILAGDVIPARDMKTGKIVYRKVKQVFKRVSDHLLTIELANKAGKVVETLKTTRQHPFYVNGRGFVPAGGLAIGNAIVTRAGPTLIVKSVKWQRRAEGYVVYNFEVDSNDKQGEDTHNYFVGTNNGGVLVHNAPTRYGGRGGGHHIHAKKAFEGDLLYNENDALALPNAFMRDKSINHPAITGAQHSLFNDLAEDVANGTRQNTWREHNLIAIESLVRGNADRLDAIRWVRQSYQDLIRRGVQPRGIPWN